MPLGFITPAHLSLTRNQADWKMAVFWSMGIAAGCHSSDMRLSTRYGIFTTRLKRSWYMSARSAVATASALLRIHSYAAAEVASGYEIRKCNTDQQRESAEICIEYRS